MASSDGQAEVQVPDSFEAFYRQEFPAVVALAFGLSGSRQAAEDLTQEAFLRVHREWARVQHMESPGGWVRVVTMNLARSRFRRLRREAATFARLGSREPTMAPTSVEFDDFWMEVGRLPRRQAEVIVLRYIDDRPSLQSPGSLA